MQMFYIAHRNPNATLPLPRHASPMVDNSGKAIEPTKEYEIQVLDDEGRAVETVYFSSETLTQTTSIGEIPNAVIEAARNLPMNQSHYVNEAGQEVSPF